MITVLRKIKLNPNDKWAIEMTGLSTDTMPSDLGNGSTMYQMDTQKKYMFDEQNSAYYEVPEGGGGSTPTGSLIGYVQSSSVLPTTRPSGDPLVIEDYVRPNPSIPASGYPFDVTYTSGGTTYTISVTSSKDKVSYDGAGGWLANVGFVHTFMACILNNIYIVIEKSNIFSSL